MKKKAEIPETIDETLAIIKESGLYVRLVDPDKEEAKEHCAYLSCNNSVALSVEDLVVCQAHSISLMHCFIPDRKFESTTPSLKAK